LKRLKDTPAPAPSEAARARALDAAKAAFAAARPHQPPQGNVVPLRRSQDDTSSWRHLMQPRTYAKVASFAAVLIGAPLALNVYTREPVAPTAPPQVSLPALESAAGRPQPAPAVADVRTADVPAGPMLTGRPISADAPSPATAAPRHDAEVAPPSAKAPLVATVPPLVTEPVKPSPKARPSTQPPAQAAAPPPPLPGRTQLGLDQQGRTTGYSLAIPRSVPGPAADSPADRDLQRRAKVLADAKRERAELSGRASAEANRMAALDQELKPREAELRPLIAEPHRDRFEAFEPNPVKQVADEPVSTFSLDVDTASYALVRRQLNAGQLPRKDTVRTEEMVNYFPYDYARPDSATEPFRPQVTVLPSPWNAGNKLVHIGIKGHALADTQRPRANLVLLIDISGSMQPADRLPLLKQSFRMLVDELKPDDTVGIVTYASGSDIRLKPTKVADKAAILAAIDSLQAGGSTSGARGLEDAYRLAEQHFDKAGVNRILLGTDGDWNVGITDRTQLKGYIERKRASGIFLSILGVGMGNHNDALMQTLARNGNGVAAYIDTLSEARKVLVEEASSSIFPIAKDVKVQIEFNPQTVGSYRLIGYEKRVLRREDFNNDKVDAGDVGSGHSVTAIYEIAPIGAIAAADPLRYGAPARQPVEPTARPANETEFGFLKLRYKLPTEDTSRLISQPIRLDQQLASLAAAPVDVRFSVAVAGFGEILRGSPHVGRFGHDDVLAIAADARGADRFGYRSEFLNLVRLAKSARP
jgi:Ca-activated chloride channel family protein